LFFSVMISRMRVLPRLSATRTARVATAFDPSDRSPFI
jgi:hypothetical protein